MVCQLGPDSAPEAIIVEDTHRWRVLGLLCLAVVLSLTTWFSAAAITPELKAAWRDLYRMVASAMKRWSPVPTQS
jgi:hypothetical protein